MKKIVAIVGMCGSGKSVASDYLVEKGWNKIYFGGVTMDELKKNNLEVNPDNERMMREKLRKEYGMAAYAILLLPKIRESMKEYDTVLDGLYSWDELLVLRKEFGDELKLIAVTADRPLRYSRLTNREIRPLTNLEAENRDVAEIENLAKGGPIAMADYYILNNGTKEEYIERLENIINEM